MRAQRVQYAFIKLKNQDFYRIAVSRALISASSPEAFVDHPLLGVQHDALNFAKICKEQ